MNYYTAASAEQFRDLIDSYLSTTDRLQVESALALARQEHGEQLRKTGEPFFVHPLTVACYLAEYRLDATALSAALLHDIAEDTKVSVEEIERQFGRPVGQLVDGVTKLKEVTQGVAQGRKLSPEELRDATLGKLLNAMTDDVRTVIIKLFDRLHNMRTIAAVSPPKQLQKAQETLAVYAPLANRLGMWEIKSELEALSLQVINPNAYSQIKAQLDQQQRDQQQLFQVVSGQIMECLLEARLDVRGIKLAPENVYTVYQDLVASGKSFGSVDKTMRLVVLLDDPIACYTALGYLHQLWSVVPNRFDDYISVRRDNLYQSLHTTVLHESGQSVKIRLRTEDMDKVAQIGVLARWRYAGPLWSKGLAEPLEVFFSTIRENIAVEPLNPTAGVRGVVEDVFGSQIRVYTPRGEIIELADGATPLDFAYTIHTELGHQCNGALVNDLQFPLNRPLRNGDQVQILKSARMQPRRAWLDIDLGYIVTNYARTHARRWFRRLSNEQAIAQGKQLLEHELEMLGMTDYAHQTVAAAFDYADTSELYHHIGRAELLPTVLSTRIVAEHWAQEPSLPLDTVVYDSTDGSRYVINNADNLRLRLCSTCTPRPRDVIVGYVRQDGGVTVHKQNCHSLEAADQRSNGTHRHIKLNWGGDDERQARLISLIVDVIDRPGLLFEITQLMDNEAINIPYICTHPSRRRSELAIHLRLELTSPRQLVRVLHQIEALVNVKCVRCVPEFSQAPKKRPPDRESGKPAPGYRPE